MTWRRGDRVLLDGAYPATLCFRLGTSWVVQTDRPLKLQGSPPAWQDMFQIPEERLARYQREWQPGDVALFGHQRVTLQQKSLGSHWVVKTDAPIRMFDDDEPLPPGCQRWQDTFSVLEKDLQEFLDGG